MEKQPNPIPNNNFSICDAVIEDLQQRKIEGKNKYNVELQAFNGRNSLLDAYQEQLDNVQYTKQWLIEREKIIEVLRNYAAGEDGYEAFKLLSDLGEI